MSITKDYRYRVGVDWEGDRLTSVTSSGKPELEVATPPEFKGGLAGVWSPEDLLVASVASCFTVTLVAVLERRDLPLRELNVSGTGHVTARDDGRFGFVAIELTATVRTEEASLEVVRHAAKYAERACLVSMALDVPVHVDLVVEPESRASAHIISAKKPTIPTAIPSNSAATLKNAPESVSNWS